MPQSREQPQHMTQVLTLTGQFGRRTVPGIQVLILMAEKTGSSHIVLDLSHVTEIDLASLRKVMLWSHHLTSHRVQVSIVKPLAPIFNNKDMRRLSEFVSIYPSLEKATWNNSTYS